MNSLTRFTIALTAASLLAAPAVYAAPASISSPIHAMFSSEKNVKISLRNDSSAALTLRVGDKLMTLGVSKTVTVEIPVGTRILVADAAPNYEAGALVVEAASFLNGNTVVLK